MSLILNIDTAVQNSSVCLAQNDTAIGIKMNPSQKDSAAWLHFAINQLLKEGNVTLERLDAVAVIEGPGSYTGLRVGMATAKGLCYALNKPLITINTLHYMAFAAKKKHTGLLCPMIDARRSEVFTAVFDQELKYVLPPANLILNEASFKRFLQNDSIVFFGNGSIKFQAIVNDINALFDCIEVDATAMAPLSHEKFSAGEFAELAYSQPFYGKDFHSLGN